MHVCMCMRVARRLQAGKESQKFQRVVVSRDEALSMFEENKFKVGRVCVRACVHMRVRVCVCACEHVGQEGQGPAKRRQCCHAPRHATHVCTRAWAHVPRACIRYTYLYRQRYVLRGARVATCTCMQTEIIKGLAADAVITIYRVGPMVDLCSGPHLPSTSYLKVWQGGGARACVGWRCHDA